MTKFNSLARARVIGPEGGAWSGGASGGAREGAADVDVLVVSSSFIILFSPIVLGWYAGIANHLSRPAGESTCCSVTCYPYVLSFLFFISFPLFFFFFFLFIFLLF